MHGVNVQEEKAADKFTDGNALQLVAYQTGAVVSRVIVKKKAGTVTVFAFDKEQGLSEHTAPFDALIQVLDGVAEITVGGVPHPLGKDEMILIPANVPHALKAVERFKMMLVMIREGDGLEQRRDQAKPAEKNPKRREHRARQIGFKGVQIPHGAPIKSGT